MGLRPSAARWFEVVVARKDAHGAMEALARSSEVQFEWAGEQGAAQPLTSVAADVYRYRGLIRKFGRY